MRNLSTVALCVVLLCAVLPTYLAGQDGPPNLIAVTEVQVKLGHGQSYEAAVKKLIAAINDTNSITVFASTSTSHPGVYTFAEPMNSMADLDGRFERFTAMASAQPGIFKGLSENAVSTNDFIVRPRPDISFVAAKPRVNDDEAGFAHTTVVRALRAHAVDFESMAKEFAAAYKKAGIQDSWLVFEAVTGDGPTYYIRTMAKTQADYYAQTTKNNEKLGGAGAALMSRLGPMLRGIENRGSVLRPDLSSAPE